jgi:formate hydrogenlyase subunit 3/multisubunit Na+/H+ antiporter MnhD subunit
VTVLWAMTVLAPIATVVGLGVLSLASDGTAGSRRDSLTRAAPLAVVPALVLTLVGPAAGAWDLPWLLLGTRLEVDPVGRPLLLVAVLLYAAALVVVGWAPTNRAPVLAAFLLVCFAGNAGVFLAADAVTFYVSFAVMSIAGYGLVVHDGTPSARRAGRVYLVLALASEAALLAALLLVVDAGGLLLADAPAAVANTDRTDLVVLLLLLGFGVKAGTVPLHVWLPLAHPAAPPAASAVLSGSMIKAGLVGWLRFLPLGEEAEPGWGGLLVALAVAGAFLAVPAGVLQADAKVALAYSSISQMGFLAVLVGVALAVPSLAEACIVASVLYAVHHGLAKGALFLGVPVWRRHGAGPAGRWVAGGILAASLAVAGAPFSSGAVAKYAAKVAVEGVAVLGVDLVVLLALVATGSTLLLARYAWLLLRETPESRGVDVELVTWSLLVGAGVVVTWVLAGLWLSVSSVPGLEAVSLWDAAWPVLLGVALAASALWLSRRERLPAWAAHPDGRVLPPGDLVVAEEALVARVGRSLSAVIDLLGRSAVGARAWLAVLPRAVASMAAATAHGERALERWQGSGLVVLALLVAALVAAGVAGMAS